MIYCMDDFNEYFVWLRELSLLTIFKPTFYEKMNKCSFTALNSSQASLSEKTALFFALI